MLRQVADLTDSFNHVLEAGCDTEPDWANGVDGCISVFSCISFVRLYQPFWLYQPRTVYCIVATSFCSFRRKQLPLTMCLNPKPKTKRKVATMQYIVAVSALYGRISLVADTAKNWERKFRLQNLLEVLQV